MAWACPLCGQINADELIKCICGNEIDAIDIKRYIVKPLVETKSKQTQDSLPVLIIVRDAFRTAWQRRQIMLRTLIIPFLVLMLLAFIRKYYSDRMFASLDLLYTLLYGLVFTKLAVTCHRVILLGDDSVPRFGSPSWTIRETRFWGWYIIACSFTFFNTYVIKPLKISGNKNSLWYPIGQLIIISIGFYLFARLSLLLPASAIDKRYGLRWAWKSTKRNGSRLIFISLIIFTVIILPVIILAAPEYMIFKKNIVHKITTPLLIHIAIVVDIIALSLSYKFLSKEGEYNQSVQEN